MGGIARMVYNCPKFYIPIFCYAFESSLLSFLCFNQQNDGNIHTDNFFYRKKMVKNFTGIGL